MAKTLIISMCDRTGKTKAVSIDMVEATTTEDCQDMVAFYNTHSDAKILSWTVADSHIVGGSDSQLSDGEYDLVNEVMRSTWRRFSDGAPRRLSIPAPRDEDVDEDEQLTSNAANDYGDALQDFWHETERPQYYGGALITKAPRGSLRKEDTAGV